MLARFNADGTLDTSFGSNGIVVTPTNGGGAVAVALQADGKIVTAGLYNFRSTTGSSWAVFRYLGDPTNGPVMASPNLVSAGSTVTLTAGNIPTGNPSSSITQVANLGGAVLGLAAGNTIVIDDNAARWGWFVDTTPRDLPGSTPAGAPPSGSNSVGKAQPGLMAWDDHNDTYGLTDTVLAELDLWADHVRWS
jgi:hypothetical protein